MPRTRALTRSIWDVFHSGFERSDTWGFRAVEPARCCITSIALVLLKTGIIHAGDAKGQEAFAAASGEGAGADGQAPQYVDGPNGMKIDQNQLATAQKLLLFWRKPAVSHLTPRLIACMEKRRITNEAFF